MTTWQCERESAPKAPTICHRLEVLAKKEEPSRLRARTHTHTHTHTHTRTHTHLRVLLTGLQDADERGVGAGIRGAARRGLHLVVDLQRLGAGVVQGAVAPRA